MRFSGCHCEFWIVFYACITCHCNVIHWWKTLSTKGKHENIYQKVKNMRFSRCHFWIGFYGCIVCVWNVIYWIKTLHKKDRFRRNRKKTYFVRVLDCVLRLHNLRLNVFTEQKHFIKRKSWEFSPKKEHAILRLSLQFFDWVLRLHSLRLTLSLRRDLLDRNLA